MRARRDLAAILALVLGVLLLATGCADDSSSGGGGGDKVDVADSEFTDETGTAEVDVAVPDNTFDPAYLMISPGTKVTWTNTGRNDHNVVAVEKGSFEGVDRDQFGPGKVHTATFDEAGDYPYYCSIHGTKNLNGQSGVIRVEAESPAS
jgi:plastocyanin